ncbi:MAG: LytTR family DNA-binding domain-containing protein [Lachnospiraceae bacterium]|nr:response regulator transcription factor [Lachnospiraceae bacterium]
MKIAVCEDQKEEADWLCTAIRSWAADKKLPVDVVSFGDAASFLFSLDDNVYDVLFLDIKMPGEDGVTLAKRLRNMNNNVFIVFVTGEKEYVMEGYEVDAVNYLLKPVDTGQVGKCLDRIYGKTDIQQPYIILDTGEKMLKLLQKEIYKIEVFSHKLVYTTERGEFEVYSSLKEAEKELQEGYFIICHRGVLVNLMHVVTIGKNSLMLADGNTGFHMEVPVSRRLYNRVNEAFIKFYRN